MPTYAATMRVTHIETWQVEANNEAEAREHFTKLSEDVLDDDSGGEVTDWEVESIKQLPE